MNGDSAIPANVVDQIWLWDRERTRVRMTKVYQHHCTLPGELAAIREQASRVILCPSEKQQQVFVDIKHAEKFRAFVEEWRAQQ